MFITLERLHLGNDVAENARLVLKILMEECAEVRSNLTVGIGINDTLREALRYLQDHNEIAVIGWEDLPIKYRADQLNITIPAQTENTPYSPGDTKVPQHFVYAFIDFPNINEEPDELLIAHCDWERLASLIRDASGAHDAIEMHLYFRSHDLVSDRVGWASEILGPSRNAGFLTHVTPKWSKDIDSHMIVDMMDMDFSHIPTGSQVTYVLVSGDRDFAPALLRKKKRAQDIGFSFNIIILAHSDRTSHIFPRSTHAAFVPLDGINLFRRGATDVHASDPL